MCHSALIYQEDISAECPTPPPLRLIAWEWGFSSWNKNDGDARHEIRARYRKFEMNRYHARKSVARLFEGSALKLLGNWGTGGFRALRRPTRAGPIAATLDPARSLITARRRASPQARRPGGASPAWTETSEAVNKHFVNLPLATLQTVY